MAEMNAKFPGTCKLCGGAFDAGARILWSRQDGARHLPAACNNEVTAEDKTRLALGMRLLNAKFEGKCRNCWEPIAVGERVWYYKSDGRGFTFHQGCPTETTQRPAPVAAQVFGGGEIKELVVEPVVPNGRYTLTLDGPDDRVYIRLSKGYDDKPGTQTVSWMRYDGDNSPYDAFNSRWVGFGTASGKEVRTWRKMLDVVPDRVLLALESLMDSESWIEYGEAYAVEFGRCFRCDSELRVPASLCRGVGPECAKILGIQVSKPEVEAWVRENALTFTEENADEKSKREDQVQGLLAL